MGTEANVMVGRLERSARLAVTLAESHRHSGEVRTAHELEAFADLFKLSASVIRGMSREVETARGVDLKIPGADQGRPDGGGGRGRQGPNRL